MLTNSPQQLALGQAAPGSWKLKSPTWVVGLQPCEPSLLPPSRTCVSGELESGASSIPQGIQVSELLGSGVCPCLVAFPELQLIALSLFLTLADL